MKTKHVYACGCVAKLKVVHEGVSFRWKVWTHDGQLQLWAGRSTITMIHGRARAAA